MLSMMFLCNTVSESTMWAFPGLRTTRAYERLQVRSLHISWRGSAGSSNICYNETS